MVGHPKSVRQVLKTIAICFSFALDQVRMRCTENDVKHLGVPADDFGHGADRVLNAFSRAEQSIGQKHRTPLQSELILKRIARPKWHIGNAVRDDVDHTILHTVIDG